VRVTPLDIRRKEFKRSVRGYADEEVDLFLDEAADELERLTQEHAELVERLRRQEEQFAGYQQLRGALEKTLVSAQIQAEETRVNARREAESILHDAESKARAVVGESYAEVQRVQQALVQLKHLEEDFRFKFRSLLDGYLKLLAEPPFGTAANAVVVEPPAGMEAAAAVAQPAVTAAQTAPAAQAAPATQVVSATQALPPVQTPFVVPSAFEEVPEYPAVTAPLRPEPSGAPGVTVVSESPVAAKTAAGAPSAAVPGPTIPAAPPVLVTEPVLQPPVGLLWPEERVGIDADDAPTGEQPLVLGGTKGTDDETHSLTGDSPTMVTDESVTLTGNEDLLRSFFPPQEGEPGAGGSGGKSKPRDFEW